ncbi:MAG: LamG domain-containing protein [Kiritimatiellia bacterium]
MIKSKILKFVLLVAGFAAGISAYAATDGDIYEIRPCTAVGGQHDPYATIASPLTSGETVYFNVRLMQRTVTDSVWRLETTSPVYDKEVALALQPLQIGIYVSGELRYADLVEDVTREDDGFTDLIFAYTTRPGDYALPIVLAVNDASNAVQPATDTDTGFSYHLNPARTGKWQIVNDAGQTANLWFLDTPVKPVSPPEGGTRRRDYSLEKCGFYVQTVDFDDDWEVEEGADDELWRSVHEKSSITIGQTPSLVVTAPVTNAVTLYVWSTDESAVKIKGGTKRTLTIGSNPTTTAEVIMGEITIAGGQQSANFQIEGVSQTGGAASDGRAELVLSSWTNYNYSASTGARLTDYITVPVQCIEPLPATISIARDDATVYAPTMVDEAYLTAVTRLSLYPTQAPTNDITVTVQPVFQADSGKTDWGNYVRFSTDDSLETLPEGIVPPTVTFLKGSTERKYLYVYALRSERAYTLGTGHQLQFKVEADADAMAAAGITALGSTGLYIDANKPLITSPTAETTLSATAGEDLELEIAINDTYADMDDEDTGYTVEVTFNGQKQTQATTFVPQGDGYTLVGKDDQTVLPKITIPATLASGDYSVSVKVTSPIRKLTSESTTFTVTVSAARSSMVELTNESNTFIEGDPDNMPQYQVTLSEAPGEVIYAFLVNYDDAPDGTFGGTGAKSIIRENAMSSAIPNSLGLRINASVKSVTGSFTLQDGASAQAGGSIYNFGVVFCRKAAWDPAEQVSGFPCTSMITLAVYNKEPTFDVNEPGFVNGFPVENGGTLGNEYPKGQIQEIQPNIADVDYDLKHGFKWKYTISRGGKQVTAGTIGHENTTEWEPDADTTIADGKDINTSVLEYNFPVAGLYTIKIQLQDKDLRTEGANKFAQDVLSFSVNIIDQPQTTLGGVEDTDTFLETGLRQHIPVGISFFPDTGETIVVKVTIQPPAGDNPGLLKLDDQYKTVPDGYAPLADNEYYVSFTTGGAQELLIEEMDGTLLSSTRGFEVTAEVMNDTESIVAGTAWKDYYRSYSRKFYVENVTPEFTNVTIPGTNAWVVAGGLATSRPIKFGIKNDVDADRDGITTFPGFKVTISGCDAGLLTPEVDAHTNPLEFYIGPDEPQSYTFTPNFGSLQGDQIITLTISDKDGGEETWTYMYTVTPSKFLHVLANGPSGGTTTSPLSQKYALADGIGEGHTYVKDAIFSSAENFSLSWNCSKQIYMSLYGFGYKWNDDPAQRDDNGTLDGRDIALDSTGSSSGPGGVTGNYYRYLPDPARDDQKRDSYFYCWLQHSQSEQGSMTSTVLNDTIAPERPNSAPGTGTVMLPTEQTEDGSYIDTMVEAIFAKEWRVADNLGDINQDGVPDVFAIKTWKGGKLLSLVYGAETDAAADLNDLAQSNPDEDYLPGVYAGSSSYAPIGPAFNTRTELRGFDLGLNATDYTVSKLEFGEEEQKAYRAATGEDYNPDADAAAVLAQWSPEPSGPEFARMDPTMEDTDGDGFPDGWEYYFWYQAHVWVPAQTATLGQPRAAQRYVFARFSIDDVLHGEEIPAAEVEARFNPCVTLEADDYAADPDFDKDGLSDLEELAIGTNPCHWDTDGDQMGDGWEVMNLLDPLTVSRSGNGDGDFFALHDLSGDLILMDGPDGDQTDVDDPDAVFYVITDGLTFGVDYDYGEGMDFVAGDGDKLKKVNAFRCIPKRLADGTVLTYGEWHFNDDQPYWGSRMVDDIERKIINIAGKRLVRPGAYLLSYVLVHNQVMQAFGFDPRTGWSAVSDGYVAARWNPGINTALNPMDTTGLAVDTRAYCNYDEYLLYVYRQNYGLVYGLPEEEAPNNPTPFDHLVNGTTNPSAAYPAANDNETTTEDGAADGETATEENGQTKEAEYAELLVELLQAANSGFRPVTTHGADTDGDGVPDGWELYVGRSPRVSPSPTGPETAFGIPLDYDGDSLNYASEYAGTDSCNAYQGCESIYQHHPGNNSGWFNKFFPTHPGTYTGPGGNTDGADTDGDGIDDLSEGGVWRAPFYYEGQVILPCEMGFIYGTPVDDGLSCCIRGAGMNPCTVDTDQDGLPDGWEMAHSGIPVDLASLTPVAPRGGSIVADVSLSLGTLIADGLTGAAGEGVYIMGGMDATWPGDACADAAESGLSYDTLLGAARDVDFDHDGLQNYQEYLVQSMRHFRYDDITTPLMGRQLTAGDDTHTQQFLGYVVFDPSSVEATAQNARGAWGANADEILGELLASVEAQEDGEPEALERGPYQYKWSEEGWRQLGYLASPAHYWDRSLTAAIISGPVYQFPVIGSVVISRGCAGYVSTDPRMADTDQDGMDDYYELFHGLNPILGTSADSAANSGLVEDGKSGDLISATYAALVLPMGDSRPTFNGFFNEWTHPDYNGAAGRMGFTPSARDALTGREALDPMLHPWVMGGPLVDADGDGIRNDEERILANAADPLPMHTDPTPQWFTERTTAASYTAQYYQTPSAVLNLPFIPSVAGDDYAAAAYQGNGGFAYVCAFEENEGYDTDNDFSPDGHEIVKAVNAVSDPLRHDDPYRRQALYLDGVDSYAMSRDTHIRPVEAADLFKQFTVECWVRPERTGVAQTILERSVAYAAASNTKDERAIRANFRIGLAADGRVYGLFDNNDAIESGLNAPTSCQRIDSLAALPLGAWSHVALSYDGAVLKLFVDGKRVNYAETTLIPANGVTQVMQDIGWGNTNNFPVASYEAEPVSFFIGARPQKDATMDFAGLKTADEEVREFFKGYIDEVRVWDGARTEDEIAADYRKRMDYTAISENREEVFRSWYQDGTRNNNDGNPTLPPELVMHYDFSTLPGALNAADVAQTPVGFVQNTIGQAALDEDVAGLYPDRFALKGGDALTTADGTLAIGWWNECVQKSTVYKDYRVVPWIENSVARLPALDGAAVDSPYYGENMSAGYVLPSAVGLQKFTFPNTALPYQGYVYNMDRMFHLNQAARLFEVTGVGEILMKRAEFQVRNSFLGTSELVPLGGAFAKTCDELWDGAAADLWEYTGSDSDADGLPDWWERYAKEQGYYTGDDLSWDTEVVYNGRKMTAADAYRLDLYHGVMPNGAGSGTQNSTYQSTVDSDGDLIADWWENFYDVAEYDAFDDPDGDGLCNYVEYLLTVVFDAGVPFDPLDAYSANPNELDYFFKIGQLYVGEIFTDHDMMRDTLEDSWGASYASRFAWDREQDADEDGWSNFAEASYNDFSANIMANYASHVVGDTEIKDLPIPTLNLRLRYNGSQLLAGGSTDNGGGNSGTEDANTLAPIVVQTYTRPDAVVADAVYNIQPGEATQNTVHLGAWSDRVVSGTLTPGYVNAGSFTLEYAMVDRNDNYTFRINDLTPLSPEYAAAYPAGLYRGSYEDYMGFLDMFGPTYVELQSSEFAWNTFTDAAAITVTQDESGQNGYICRFGERIGTINLMTGSFRMNLEPLKDIAATNTSASVSLAQSVLRITYDSVVPKLQSNKLDLYLGEAQTGYVKEGKNMIVAFYDLDGNGKYTAGEPMGCAVGVDVGWNRAAAEIELTDTSPIITRADLLTGTSDRKENYGTDDGDYYNLIEGELSGGNYQRLRVVRTLINGWGVNEISGEDSALNRVLVDRWVELDQRSFFFEGDVLLSGEFDIDWSTFDEVAKVMSAAKMDPTNITYRIVLGNGSISTADTNNLFSLCTVRHFDAKSLRNRPIALTPGSASSGSEGSVIYGSHPTFTWKMENGATSYTAFQVQVLDGATVVWDSGTRRAPARNDAGVYTFEADAFVGDELENEKNYTWRVAMYNAKFQTPLWSQESLVFRMNTPTSGFGYGAIPVCVRYFGPTVTEADICVEAFVSPDFSGTPAARTTVADVSSVGRTNAVHAANATLIGLAPGTYYVRAYVDLTKYGTSRVRDSWEAWGYACPRERDLDLPYVATAVEVENVTGEFKTVEVYIEDVDTNGNAVPDTWEIVKNGGTLSNGAENLDDTLVTMYPVATSFGSVASASGPMAEAMRAYLNRCFGSLDVAALVMDVPVASLSVSSTGSIIVEGEVAALDITGIALEDGRLTLKVSAQSETAADGLGVYDIVSEVNCTVCYKTSLDQTEWTELGTTKVSVGGEAVSVSLDGVAGDSAFFKVVVEKVGE